MRYGWAYITVVVLLFSCGSAGKEEEKTPAPDTAQKQEQEIDTATVKPVDSIPAVEQPIVLNDIPKTKEVNERLKYFIDKYSVNYKEIHPDELKVHVLDRFGCEKKYKVYLEKKIPVLNKQGKVFPVAEIHAYVYKDSAQCANAVNNWFNCFGSNCEIIQPGAPAALNSSKGYYILNEKNIICLDYQPEYNQNNWKGMYKDLEKLFVNRESKVIEIRDKGVLVWVQ